MCRLALIALGCLLFTSQAQAKLKVFILAGQSNMQGAGAIKINPKSKNGGKGTLEYLVKEERLAKRLAHVVDASGDWVVRDDVWIKYFDRKGGLTVGYGAKRDRIGPEFQFGHALGQVLDEQVLLIKTAWGGRCLATDFRPPRSGGRHLKSGSPGAYYTLMVDEILSVLKNLKTPSQHTTARATRSPASDGIRAGTTASRKNGWRSTRRIWPTSSEICVMSSVCRTCRP